MNLAMKWIDDLRGTDSIREVARKAEIPQPTLARQINNAQLTFETVRDVSRAYGRSVLADLIALGHLSEADAGIEGIERVLAAATDEQLVVEIGKRLDVTPSSMVWDAPVSDAVERASNVTRLPQTGGTISAIDMLDDAGTIEYDGLKAADRGEHLADSIPAVDEDPEPEDDPK